MGAIAAIVGSGCCCGGTIDPCDCELTSIQVSWSGSMTAAWGCDVCGITPDDAYVEGEVSISGISVTLAKIPLSCSFKGSVSVWGDPLLNCASHEETDFALQLDVTCYATWHPTTSRWRVYIDIHWKLRRLSTGVTSSSGNGHWCAHDATTFDKDVAFEATSAQICPSDSAYDPVDGTSLCPAWTSPGGPACSGLVVTGFPFYFAPGIVDFDYGNVSVT